MSDVIIQLDDLKLLISNKLCSAGLKNTQAECIADVLVHADARGVRSHGSIRVEHYCNRINKGGINLSSDFVFTPTAKASGILDVNGGMGHYGVYLAMKEAINRVKDTGIYAISVKNSDHCGALSYFSEMSIDSGLISMIMVNTDSCVVPFGASEGYLGTNPIAFGFPGKRHRILIDLATSEVTFGKILLAREKGEMIPATWGVDKFGAPTTDPNKVAYITPMAGHRGTAIALAIEGFTGLFTGFFGPHITSMYNKSDVNKYRNTMAFILVVDPGVFGSQDDYFLNTDKIFNEIKRLRPAPGIERLFVPGEPEDLNYQRSIKEGCAVYKKVLDFLKS
ncbi:MAG: Ldh family oxidoreductase [Brevinema sp.]